MQVPLSLNPLSTGETERYPLMVYDREKTLLVSVPGSNAGYDALHAAAVKAGRVRGYFYATLVGDGSVTVHHLAPLPPSDW